MRSALLLLLVVACQRVATTGQEREDCRPDKTCDQGLLCLSNRCVRPPPADCDHVADVLASLELGNYAPREQREPTVAHHKEACERTLVSKDEGACLDKATDTWSATACVPRMFPKQATAGGDCTEVVNRVRQAVQVGQVGADAQKLIEKMMPAMLASCTEDSWPESLKQCIVASKPGELAALEKCNAMMPKALQDKLQQRMMQSAPNPSP